MIALIILKILCVHLPDYSTRHNECNQRMRIRGLLLRIFGIDADRVFHPEKAKDIDLSMLEQAPDLRYISIFSPAGSES